MCPSGLQNCYGAVTIHLLPPPPLPFSVREYLLRQSFPIFTIECWMYGDILGTTSSCEPGLYDKVLDPKSEPDAEVGW